ncbi:MAG: oligosaccharide flippase family protein [Candidatus ainarchaeum sp.]|nr:oligosaccharide flippase family protein [Candidatus ainarchaeum sp.]
MALDEHKAVVRGTAWGMAGNIFFKVISFVYLMLSTRLFSQQDIGTFYLGLGFISILGIFGDLGLFAAFTRFIPYYMGKGEKKKAYALLRGAYWFVTFFSLLMAMLILIGAPYLAESTANPGLKIVMWALAFFVLANSLLNLNSYSLLSMKNVKMQVLLSNSQHALKLVLTVLLFVFIGSNVLSLTAAYTASFVLAAVLSFWYVKRMIDESGIASDVTVKDQIEALKEAVPFGAVLSVITAMWIIISSSDRIILGYMIDPSHAADIIAVYALATTLGGVVSIFPAALGNIFLPIISELYAKGKKKEMLESSMFATRWVLILMVPAAMLLISLPKEILVLFYGSAYAPGALVLSIFTIGVFLRTASTVHSSILAAMRLVKIELGIVLFGAVLNVILNVMLIPGYGMEGAAFASAIALTSVSLLLFYYCRKFAGGTFLAGSVRPFLAALLALGAFFLLKDYSAILFGLSIPLPAAILSNQIYQKVWQFGVLGVLFLVCCAIYFVFLSLLRAFGKEDIELLRSAFRRVGMKDSHMEIVWMLMRSE